jgi:hypothetical protein
MKTYKSVGYTVIGIITLSLVMLSLYKVPTQFALTTPLFIGQDFDLLRSPLSPSEIRLAALQGYEQGVHQSVTSSGITLTIGNIYADPLQFEFDMVESFSSQIKNQPVIGDQGIKMDINGTEALYNFSGGEFEQADGNRYAGVVIMPMGNITPFLPLPDEFVLNVHIGQIGNVKGNWSFSIPVSQAKLTAASRLFHPNIEKTSDKKTFKTINVATAPNQTIIQARFTEPDSAQSGYLGGRYRFLVTDEDNKSLNAQIAGTLSTTTGGVRVYDVLIDAARLPDTAKQLTITPMLHQDWTIAHASGGSITMTEPPVLADPSGPLVITSISFVSYPQKTMVYLTTMNSATYDGQPMLYFYLEDHEPNGIYGRASRKEYSVNGNELVAEFPRLDPAKQYSFRLETYTPLTGLAVRVATK